MRLRFLIQTFLPCIPSGLKARTGDTDQSLKKVLSKMSPGLEKYASIGEHEIGSLMKETGDEKQSHVEERVHGADFADSNNNVDATKGDEFFHNVVERKLQNVSSVLYRSSFQGFSNLTHFLTSQRILKSVLHGRS